MQRRLPRLFSRRKVPSFKEVMFDSEGRHFERDACLGLLHREYDLVKFDLNKADIVLKGE